MSTAESSSVASTASSTHAQGHHHRRGRRHHQKAKPETNGKGAEEEPSSETHPYKSTAEASRTASMASENQDADLELCFICADPMETVAMGPCNHRHCFRCSLRLRALYKNFSCVYCKTDLERVIFTNDQTRDYASFTEKDLPARDTRIKIAFHSRQIHETTKAMLKLNCPSVTCDVLASSYPALSKHIKEFHERHLCDICLRNKKVFAHEHTMYTKHELQDHYRGIKEPEGSISMGTSGHPECEFCRFRLYDSDALYEHCRDKHEQCHICVRLGLQRWYMNYDELWKHFKEDHFVCEDPTCLGEKFVVFSTDVDLKRHTVELHGVSGSGQRAQKLKARQIDVHFSVGRGTAPSSSNANVSSTRREAMPSSVRSSDFPPVHVAATTAAVPPAQRRFANVPAGYGQLSTPEPTPAPPPPSTALRTTSDVFPEPTRPDSIAFADTMVARIRFQLGSDLSRISQFRGVIAAFFESRINSTEYINALKSIAWPGVETPHARRQVLNHVVNQTVIELREESRSSALLRAWNDARVLDSQQNDDLDPNSFAFRYLKAAGEADSVHHGGDRALGVKKSMVRSGVNIWDRIASASTPQASFPPLGSRASGPRGTVSSGVPRTAWSQSSRSSTPTPQMTQPSVGSSANRVQAPARGGGSDFPSLPTREVARFTIRRQPEYNAWDASGASRAANDSQRPASDAQTTASTSSKKKKGKQVLMRVG